MPRRHSLRKNGSMALGVVAEEESVPAGAGGAMSIPCAACQAKDQFIAFLQEQVRDLTERLGAAPDRILALVNPAALAVSRGQAVSPAIDPRAGTPTTLQGHQADVVDEHGQGWMWIDGSLRAVEEVLRVRDKVDEMIAGRSPAS